MNANKNLVHITQHTEGSKMDSFRSISTSTLFNEQCRKNALVKGSICEKCFGETTLKMRKGLREATENNFYLLTGSILEDCRLPRLNDRFFRLESFGDLANETQFINYLNICKVNPYTNFAIWTKNPHIMDNVFKQGYKKPENLNIVVSSLMLNQVRNVEKYKYFVDVVFTVYTCDFAIENNVKINCGILKCIECLKCYKEHNSNDIIYINEILKSQSKKYYSLIGKEV